jgi:hypothetical protein
MVAQVQTARRATPSQEVIFLDEDDELATVRAKLEATPADDVYLVVPRRAAILRTPLEFRILARFANELSADPVIVSGDANRRALARHEGLRTRKSIRSVRGLAGQSNGWSWGLWAIPEVIPLPSIGAVAGLLAIAAVAGLVALATVPVMKVTVSPRTMEQRRELEITVDPTARQTDVARAVVPGDVIQQRIEVVANAPATGTRTAARERARGELMFAGPAVAIPRGSIVAARNGARYQTDADAQVTGGQPARVPATALEPGAGGNVAAGQIVRIEVLGSGAPPGGLTVRNERPFAGGSDREARSVTEEDVNQVKQRLSARAREQVLAELFARATSDRSLVQPSLQLRAEIEQVEPAVDSEAEQVNGRFAGTASAVVFSNSVFNDLVRRIFINDAGAGWDLGIDRLRVGIPQVQGVDDQRRVKIKSASEATLVRQIDPAVVTERVRWKSPDGAREALASMGDMASQPAIELSPSWAPWAYRVEVVVK